MDSQSRPSRMNVRHKPWVRWGRDARTREWRRRCSKRVHETCKSDEATVRDWQWPASDEWERGSQSESTLTRIVRKSPRFLRAFQKQLFDWVLWWSEKFCRSDKTNFCKQTQRWWKHKVFWKTFVLLYSFDFSNWTAKQLISFYVKYILAATSRMWYSLIL